MDHTITAAPISPSATSWSVPCSGQTWRSSTATHTTTARPERFQARTVRSSARPASGGSGEVLISFGPEGGDHHGDGPDGHDADGENQWHPRTRQGVTPTHGALVGTPLSEALGGDESAQSP